MTNEIYDMLIVGSGIVGYGTAVYAGRFNMKTVIIGEVPGGVITTTDVVENYPGFKKLSGFELAEKVKEHAQDYNTTIISDKVIEIKKNGKIFEALTLSNEKYFGKAVVFATGTEWRKLKVPGEAEYFNKGVHYCALCDGAFYRNKIAAVIGGADSAAKDALVLAQFCSKVYIIYRKEKIHPEPINMKRVEEKIKEGKIEIINNTNIVEVKGDGKKLTHVILDKEYKGSNQLNLDGLFPAIGLIPQNELARQLGVKLNDKGQIIIDENSMTNVEGVYAAGDIGNRGYKQAITGAAEGVMAAFSAYNYINIAYNDFSDE